MEENIIIRIENITKEYDLYANPKDRFREAVGIKKRKLHKDFRALNNICFDVKRGETVGIVGTNGSGKSTLLKIITGVLKPTKGKVYVQGRISALLELGAGFNQEYTGLENIYLNGRMMGYSRKEMEKRIPIILDFAEIGEFIDQPVKTYSSGMFARLAFAVAINVEPDILVVDEALSVGDLFFQNKCYRKFDELREQGITILFVSHDISSVRQMCSRVLWIEKGEQIIFDKSDMVCDMYMDHKRMGMNELYKEKNNQKVESLGGEVVDKDVKFPKISWENSSIKSKKVSIISVYLTDIYNQYTNKLEVDQQYIFHIVIKLEEDMQKLIVGTVVENNKGMPLYDFNNFISTGRCVEGFKGQVLEINFDFNLPRIMRGHYLVSAAVAQGTQGEHIMLTWLHNVMEIEIINSGFNSSYIEIPAKVRVNKYDCKRVEIV